MHGTGTSNIQYSNGLWDAPLNLRPWLLTEHRWNAPSWGRGSLPQKEEFKYLGFLLVSDDRLQRKMHRGLRPPQ